MKIFGPNMEESQSLVNRIKLQEDALITCSALGKSKEGAARADDEQAEARVAIRK